MANPFRELRERLLHAGVAPRHVRRYITELDDHLADLRAEEERAGRGAQDAAAAALVRLGGTEELARAMLERPQLRSWCSRAPWVAVGVAPLTALAGAYFLACMILWMGWRIFLPDAGTPFVRLDGAAVLFFWPRQADLFWCANFSGLVRRAYRRSAEVEGCLACGRLGADCAGWWNGPSACEEFRCDSGNEACRYES
jgi:hypothetical protein